jgi:hypothetical protein
MFPHGRLLFPTQSLNDWRWAPWNKSSNTGNRHKSDAAKSGEWGGRGNTEFSQKLDQYKSQIQNTTTPYDIHTASDSEFRLPRKTVKYGDCGRI